MKKIILIMSILLAGITLQAQTISKTNKYIQVLCETVSKTSVIATVDDGTQQMFEYKKADGGKWLTRMEVINSITAGGYEVQNTYAYVAYPSQAVIPIGFVYLLKKVDK